MSKTDLEEDLRATFERAAASVPVSPDLAARATSGARQQHKRRTVAASGAAVVAVAAVAAGGFALQSRSPAVVPEPAAGPEPVVTTAPTAMSAQLVSGSWRPVMLEGSVALKAARPEDPTLSFSADGKWAGSDGCNNVSGTFTIGQRGEFSSSADGQRLIGCDNVPHTAILAATKRLVSDRATLRFYGADGRELATYARAR